MDHNTVDTAIQRCTLRKPGQKLTAKVKAADGYTYYMAEALLDKVLGKLGSEETPAYEVLEKYVGKDLEYKEYEPLFACAGEAAAKQKKKAHFVTCR